MTDLKPSLDSFENLLEETIRDTWGKEDMPAYLSDLADQPEVLLKAAERVGDIGFEVLKENGGGSAYTEVLSAYIIDFTWADRVKSFFILWRDVLFQQLKAQVLFLEEKVEKETILALKNQSEKTMIIAADELNGTLENETAAIKRIKNGIEKKVYKWKHQQNPWPIYKEQLKQLADQCQRLKEEQKKLGSLVEDFYFIKQMIRQELDWCKKEINEIKTSTENIIDFVEKNIEEKPGSIPSFLENVDNKLNIRNHLNEFNDIYEKKLEVLEGKMQVPVNIENGLIHFKEINFKKITKQWLESEILPVFYEIWELTDNVVYGKKMSLVNIRNRAIVLANESSEAGNVVDRAEISQPLKTFLKKASSWETNFEKLEKIITDRLDEKFDVSNVYSLKKDFLPIPLEYTINQFGFDRGELAERIKGWVGAFTGTVAQIKTSVEQEEMMSISEKIVRFIQSRKAAVSNNQYASIFLTKGYLGESFWIGRENEIQHVQNVIEQWQEGYRGATILAGPRHCGKSLFGDMVANRFFYGKTIRLLPNEILNLQGRKIDPGYDLGKALGFIKKYALNEKLLVWIDDLELWNGNDFSLHANVRQLKKYIDDYSGRLFFMVATSNWVKAHLYRIFEINKIFQTEIQLDRMELNEVRRAILIRHGATHKILVDKNSEEVTPQQFGKIISRIYKSVEGNIGDTLNQWAYSAEKVDEEKVTHEYNAHYYMPDFINPDNAVLLAAIMMDKRTTEYRLRKMFGPAFTTKYANILKRLLRVGILSRQLDGSLELNEVAANETARLLARKNYLKFAP